MWVLAEVFASQCSRNWLQVCVSWIHGIRYKDADEFLNRRKSFKYIVRFYSPAQIFQHLVWINQNMALLCDFVHEAKKMSPVTLPPAKGVHWTTWQQSSPLEDNLYKTQTHVWNWEMGEILPSRIFDTCEPFGESEKRFGQQSAGTFS